jgi:uncharacterized membrane protein YeiH
MLIWLDLLGVAVFAVSGALAAMQAGLDFFGVLVLAAITAIGGGTLRDLLLNRHPVFWLHDQRYIAVIVAAAVAAIAFAPFAQGAFGVLLIADALGLGLFALTGAQIAEEERLPPFPIVLAGTLTATGGGLIRDLVSGQVPLLLRQDITLYLLLQKTGVRRTNAFLIGVFCVVVLRLAALRWGWQLPILQMAA